MNPADEPVSVRDVCDVEIVRGDGAGREAAPDLLIEVPHGATSRVHYDAIRSRLRGRFPDGLDEFFFVNTDVGAYECALAAARMIADPAAHPELLDLLGDGPAAAVAALAPRKVLVLRGLVPRTFIDCNRVAEVDSSEFRSAGFTPAVPAYITEPEDAALLQGLHAAYQDVARRAFARVCGAGGSALILHTYAPKSVRIVDVDEHIVVKLRRAYEPGEYAKWDDRPAVDVISAASDGTPLAPPRLVEALRRYYAARKIEAAENATYRLHPATLGHRHSTDYPGRVLCMEISRATLADPFVPFQEMKIGEHKVATMAAPIAAAQLVSLVEAAGSGES